MSEPAAAATPDATALATGLDELLLASLKALAAAGEVDQACRLAGQACALYRQRDLVAWQRYNGLLHRLAKRATGAGAPG